MTPASAWTTDRVDQLRALWAEGLSAAAIAVKIGGGLSRNAIIGKRARLGLPERRRKSVVQSEARPRQRRRATYSNFVSVGHVFSPHEVLTNLCQIEARNTYLDESKLVTFAHLERHHCRWPYGDPGDTAFRFCGCRRRAESPYCASHHDVAYRRLPGDGRHG